MRKYSDNIALLKSIKTNNVKEIKNLLIDNIFFVKGNRSEIFASAEFAEKESDFRFDSHIDVLLNYNENTEEKFSEEKFNMRSNFSKERFDNLVEIYKEVYMQEKDELHTSDRDILPVYSSNNEFPSSSDFKKMAIIAISIVVIGYVIYKIID